MHREDTDELPFTSEICVWLVLLVGSMVPFEIGDQRIYTIR